MNKEKEHALNAAFEKFMDMSLMQIPIVDAASSYLSDDIMGWGTTIDEDVRSLSDWAWLINRQIEQAKEMNLDFHFDRQPCHSRFHQRQDFPALFYDQAYGTRNGLGFITQL